MSLGAGITIGSRTIRFLEVKRKKDGSWQVTKALIAPITDPAASDAKRVAEAKAALKVANSKARSLVGLSGKELIIRYTQVPPVPDWRLEMLMNFEIQEVSEQSGGDVSAAYAQLGIDDATSGDNVVLVALAKNGHLVPRLTAAAESGLDVLGGCPRAVAAFWAYKENAKLSSDDTVFFMHVGNENTDVAIARKGVLIFARNVAGGSKLFTDALVQAIRLDAGTAEKSKITKGNLTPRNKAKYRDSAEEKIANSLMGVAGHFVSAFNSSLMFAKAQTKVPDCQPSKLVIMGSGALLKGFPEYLESSLSIPVEVFDPISSLDLSALEEKTAEALKQDQGGMAVTLGLAQMAADDAAFRVEILPAADKKKRRFMRHTAVSIAAAVVLLGCLIASWTMLSSASARAETEKADLDAKGKEFSGNDAQMDAARKRVEEDNAEKRQLERLVSAGPVFQHATDAVHEILNETTDPATNDKGISGIHIEKVGVKFIPVTVQITAENRQEIKNVPQVDFRGVAVNRGAANAVGEYQLFSTALTGKIQDMKDFVLEMQRLDPQSGRFDFTIRAKAPIEIEQAEAARAAAGENH